MNKESFEDILFWLDDMYWHSLNKLTRLATPVGDLIHKLPPIQRYRKRKHEQWKKRQIRFEDIRRTFCTELKSPDEYKSPFLDGYILDLFDEDFNNSLDTHFIKKLQKSKQLGASELICSPYLPLHIEEKL